MLNLNPNFTFGVVAFLRAMLIVDFGFTITAKAESAIAFTAPQTFRAFDDPAFGTIAFMHHASPFGPQTAILILTRPSFSMKPTWTASE